MVVATNGEVTAVWQVETDPAVQLGDFSGAWLITPDGIEGFAATAEWIEGRDDPQRMLDTLLRFDVWPAHNQDRQRFDELMKGLSGGVQKRIVDEGATVSAARDAIEAAREDFAATNPGKRQPAWGTIGEVEDGPTRAPEGLGEDETAVVTAALATAHGVRTWLGEWAAFEKTRARRLPENPHSEFRRAPLR